MRSLIRWNAIATILRANKESSELGGHIASFQSAAMLYEIGFNHFWHAPSAEHGGDLIYIQGHSSPGIYARAFLEGRITEEQLEGFRQEVSRPGGLCSYPHPWLMPDFWQFPTVSMGLGPIMAIYQARFMRYLTDRGIKDTLGPQGLGVPRRRRDRRARVARRDRACRPREARQPRLRRQLQPAAARRARCAATARSSRSWRRSSAAPGWNVLKVIWGDRWDPLLADDDDGLLVKRMEEAVDGEYQVYKARDGGLRARAVLRQVPGARRARGGHDRRGDLGPQPRRPRRQEGLRRLRRGAGGRAPARR